MAKIVENSKGFKVIQVEASEVIQKVGSFGICDHCGSEPVDGYYVAVLNRWFCPDCYQQWLETATYYEEDSFIENKHFNFFKSLLFN